MKSSKVKRVENSVSRMIRLREEARNHLARASVLLLDWPLHKDNMPQAIVWIGLAMLRLSQSDENCEAGDRAQEIVTKYLAPAAKPRVPGPYSGT